jgi:hypothetical protein
MPSVISAQPARTNKPQQFTQAKMPIIVNVQPARTNKLHQFTSPKLPSAVKPQQVSYPLVSK